MKKIILCADDYGQNTSVSQAILHLLENKRLSATSCLTTYPDWYTQAGALRSFKSQASLGLHFNLTEGKPLSTRLQRSHGFMPLSQLLLRSSFRQLDQSAIEEEVNAQLDAFREAMGCWPDFIDGHQHIHQFPVIRDALIAAYEKKLRGTTCYFRSTAESYLNCLTQGEARFKRLVLQLSGAQSFKKLLIQRNIPHNTSFSGVYDFKKAARYAEFFPTFLANVNNDGLILCHPGLSSETKDPLQHSRIHEFNYLASDQFILDCERAGVLLV